MGGKGGKEWCGKEKRTSKKGMSSEAGGRIG